MEDRGQSSAATEPEGRPRRRRGVGPFSLRQVAGALGIVVVAAILLTQTRTGLVGLPITAAVFTWRASRHSFRTFAISAIGVAALLVYTRVPEFSLGTLQSEWGRRVTLTGAASAAPVS